MLDIGPNLKEVLEGLLTVIVTLGLWYFWTKVDKK